ncbi:UBX domain-containing protein 10 isoform X1 [Anas platyrhynchos]|uniref:UBX domain-containing protein 10 isoform X1 n=2 Tax=Anas platyrhynchos TaxID=8839 RepID=UPI003AF2C1E9
MAPGGPREAALCLERPLLSVVAGRGPARGRKWGGRLGNAAVLGGGRQVSWEAMATAALLNSAPAHCYVPPSTAAPFFQPAAAAMHVTRPKSAKGRTRSAFSYSGAFPCRVPPSPAAPHEFGSSPRASSTHPPFPPSHVSPEEIPKLLQQVPLRSSSSLNKYRVLPSIGRKDTVAEPSGQHEASWGQEGAQQSPAPSGERGSASGLAEIHIPGEGSSCAQRPPEKPGGQTRRGSPSLSPQSLEEALQKEPQLLLAVRSPSGQRFEHCFKPTDSLQTVLSVAEQKTVAKYERCSIETMEVPRRSFPDLSRTLQECGILPRSVLCIRQAERHEAEL